RTLLAFVVFCLVASGTYMLNDLIDRDADRLHPTKQNRPIAAGTVSSGQAVVACAVLLAAGLGLALAFQEWGLALVAGIYVAVTSGVAMPAYCLWAFERATPVKHGIWAELTIVPFVLAILRYALLLEQGQGGAPEDVVLRDRPLQILGGLWAVLFAVSVYAH